MSASLAFLLQHGYWLTVGSVFLEQLGIPLPAVPVLVGMGALSRFGHVSFFAIILISLIASISADLIWYRLGRTYGRSVLGLLCRISLEPDYCVRRTEDTYERLGVWTLLFAKFIPGLNAAAVPLAGMIRTRLLRFLLFDSLGAMLWTGAYASLGYVFSTQIERLLVYLSQFGNSVPGLLLVIAAAYVGYKFWERRSFARSIEVERITPEELKARMESSEKIKVLDLRNQLDVTMDRVRIPGAFHVLPEVLSPADLPRNEELILYCS